LDILFFGPWDASEFKDNSFWEWVEGDSPGAPKTLQPAVGVLLVSAPNIFADGLNMRTDITLTLAGIGYGKISLD